MKYAINEEIKFEMEMDEMARLCDEHRRESMYGDIFDRRMNWPKKPNKVSRQMRRHFVRKAGMR